MSRTKSALFGAVSSQLFMVISMLVNIISTPYIVKGLSSEIYGLSIIIFQITGYLGNFDFGLGAGVTRFLASTRGENLETQIKLEKVISTSFVVYTLLGALVALAGIVLAPFAVSVFNIPKHYSNQVQPIITIVCLLVGLQFLLRSISGIFFAHQKQVLSNALSFALAISNTLLILLFINLGFELWSFIYAQIVGFIINCFLNVYYFRKYYKYLKVGFEKFDVALLKEMFSYGFFIFLNGVAVQVVFQTDRVLVGSIVSLAAVSIYSLSTKVPELASGLIWKISENAFPGMVELSNANKNEVFVEIHDKLMQLTLSISSSVFWVVLLASFPFIKLWVGEQFFAGTYFIVLVSYLYLIHHTYQNVTSVCLNSAGIVKGFSLMSLLEAALNILLSIWFCKRYGLIGVVWGTLIASTLTSGWFVPYAAAKYKEFKLISYLKVMLKPILICSLLGICEYLLLHETFKSIDSWTKLICYSAGISILFIIPIVFINKSILLNISSKLRLVSSHG